ncbi:MAG TPA: iron-containing redox enzyme family protein [Chloroflexota bacterium]
MIAAESLATETLAQVHALANAQFESAEFQRLLETPLTLARARFFSIEMARYVANRRDCWGFAQGAAPLDVKRLIWRHEQEELILDPHVGMDHVALATREARVLGLTPEDFEAAESYPGSVAAFYAWIHLAKDRPWIQAVASCSALEVRNSSAVIAGGGLSGRIRQKLIDELHLPADELINQERHVVADQEHADLMTELIEGHVRTEEDQRAVLHGVHETYLIDRAFRGALAAGLAALD